MREIQRYRVWRNVTADATFMSSYKESDRPEQSDDRMQAMNTASVILIRAFGTDAANEDALFRIVGWMRNGPGELLLTGSVTLGSLTIDEPPMESCEKNPFSTGTTYYEADNWDITGNACEAYHERTGENTTSHLIIHTMEYYWLMLEVDIDGGSSASSSMGFIYKELVLS